jgi:phage tail tube protein FII
MSAAKPLVNQITQYLGQLNSQQQKTVLSVVKSFVQEEDWWNNKTYMAEMDRRFSEMESGTVKGLTLDEAEKKVRQSYKNSKGKKQ